MNVKLPYGDEAVTAVLAGCEPPRVLDISDAPEVANLDSAIRESLRRPIDLSTPVARVVRPGESVAILVSDSFRQTRIDRVLPILVAEFEEAGVSPERIRFVFATGTHRGPTEPEARNILGDAIYDRFRGQILSHDPWTPSELTFVGTTSRGTKVSINRRVYECDRIIATGSVVMHYFGGYGGGRKSVVPGVASAETIAHNHALNLDPESDRLNPAVRIGAMEGNPVAEDMLEGTKLVGVDAIVNTVLNRKGQIAGIFAGELEAAHAAACTFARSICAVPLERPADLVIAASPHTRNFVQTHKALFNANLAVRPGGRIVLLAPCPEGIGGEQFVKWLRLEDRAAIIRALRKQSEINGQTALSTIEKGPHTLMVTGMPEDDVRLLRARKEPSFQAAIDTALAELRANGAARPTVCIMPSAAYSVPILA